MQGEASRALVAEGRVGPFGIVVSDPSGDQIAGTGQIAEQRFVQEFEALGSRRLGSRLIDRPSQNMTVAGRATAERKVFAHLS